MKTFALVHGDLVPAPGGYQMIDGASKIQQDIALALREAYGGDLYHPRWGSILSSLIGGPLTAEMRQDIVAEVQRVLTNYITVQNARIVQDNNTGSLSSLTTDDVVAAIEKISVQQNQDTAQLTIALQTVSRQQVQINQTLS